MKESIIKNLKLSDEQVLKIVMEWYVMGMCPDIFQNEDGQDLEEYLEEIANLKKNEEIINEAITIFCNKHSKLKYKYENFKTLIKNCLEAYQKEKDEREGIDIDFFRKENLKVFFYEQICNELKHINVLEKRNQMGDYTRVSLAIFLYFACTGKKLRANHEVTVRNLRLSAGSLSEFKKKRA